MSDTFRTRNVWVASALLATGRTPSRVVSLRGPHFRCSFVFDDADGSAAGVVRAFRADEPTQRLIRARRVVGEMLELVSQHGVAEPRDLDPEALAAVMIPWSRR